MPRAKQRWRDKGASDSSDSDLGPGFPKVGKRPQKVRKRPRQIAPSESDEAVPKGPKRKRRRQIAPSDREASDSDESPVKQRAEQRSDSEASDSSDDRVVRPESELWREWIPGVCTSLQVVAGFRDGLVETGSTSAGTDIDVYFDSDFESEDYQQFDSDVFPQTDSDGDDEGGDTSDDDIQSVCEDSEGEPTIENRSRRGIEFVECKRGTPQRQQFRFERELQRTGSRQMKKALSDPDVESVAYAADVDSGAEAKRDAIRRTSSLHS